VLPDMAELPKNFLFTVIAVPIQSKSVFDMLKSQRAVESLLIVTSIAELLDETFTCFPDFLLSIFSSETTRYRVRKGDEVTEDPTWNTETLCLLGR